MALTDFRVAIIDKAKATRVVVTASDEEMIKYLSDHEVLVFSHETGEPIRITPDKPIAASLLPDVIRAFQRSADVILEGRSMGSLATEEQLHRARMLSTILAKRKDNVMVLPANADKFTLGQIGRWIHDAKTVLIAEGRWDDEKKEEIIKE